MQDYWFELSYSCCEGSISKVREDLGHAFGKENSQGEETSVLETVLHVTYRATCLV